MVEDWRAYEEALADLGAHYGPLLERLRDALDERETGGEA